MLIFVRLRILYPLSASSVPYPAIYFKHNDCPISPLPTAGYLSDFDGQITIAAEVLLSLGLFWWRSNFMAFLTTAFVGNVDQPSLIVVYSAAMFKLVQLFCRGPIRILGKDRIGYQFHFVLQTICLMLSVASLLCVFVVVFTVWHSSD
jgi:hypothetical protein